MVRKQLEQQLLKIKREIEVLNMKEEKLIKMKRLINRVIENDLEQKEISLINKQVKAIGKQVDMLRATNQYGKFTKKNIIRRQ
ncbi:hypothetical protein SAMN05660297_00715 [Natronincola peptidivorans]|uniref:Uncharacterized protein n=2 Tax=Natronincola peptidivorans TaxID=426128 RepID=A0A1H9ZT89_9FIRM|nr:hypothetical protein SAMN05660297_00715 [Natronincola peptidivorans]